jgi:surface polysaccharide O-acyltransferase-like enzyme
MKRNYGVDFLRIISMFMVVILHVLGHGGILKQAEPFTTKYWIAWLLEISCYCAVNWEILTVIL